MRSSLLSVVCLSATSLLAGCGPEPTAKDPTLPSPSATTSPPPAGSASAAATNEPPPSTPTSAPAASASAAPVPTTQPLVGDMSSADIEKALNANIKEFDACYTLGADKQGKLDGTVTIKATVGPLGNVKEATVVKSTMKNPKVDACVAAAFKKVTFPHPKGGVAIITYPMTFGGEVVIKK